MKKTKAYKFFIAVTSVFFILCLLEICSALFIRFSPLRTFSHNDFADGFSLKTGCTFVETIIAHPMLGFVHRKNDYLSERCQKHTKINNIGIHTARSLPLKKIKDDFAIMILGGSVAHQFAEYQDKSREIFLEKLLNEKYYPPRGKRFRVYTGAAGAWAMPNQLKMLLMYGERLDGIIALDGYNESLSIAMGRRLERVPEANSIMASSSVHSFRHTYLRFLWNYHQWLKNSWLIHSSFFEFTYRGLSALFQSFLVSPELVEEFSRGNMEVIDLPLSDAQLWSLNSLYRYNLYLHQSAKLEHLLSAQFLQPSRLYGKTLTAEEARYQEYADKSIYQKIETSYEQLKKAGHNVRSMTGLFWDKKETLYADHIHFKKNEDGFSPGLALIAEQMATELGDMWRLKRR